MTFIDHTSSREDLEVAIMNDRHLYRSLNEDRFLNSDYTDAELLSHIVAWIEAGDECAR